MRLIDKLAKNRTAGPIIERVRNSDIGSRMAKGAFWSITGTSLAKVIVLIAGVFCARLLGKDEYGEFGMVRSTVSMLVVFGSLGLGLTASKYLAEFRINNKSKASSIYVLTSLFSVISGVILTIVITICAPYLASVMLDAPYLTNDIRLGGLLLFVTILNSAQNGVLAGFEDFRSIAINTFIASIAEGLFMLAGAYYFGVSGAILGFGIGYVILYVCNFMSIRTRMKELGIGRKIKYISREDVKILYKFSIPAALSGIMVAPVFWYLRSLLVRTAGFGEIAVFDVADQWKLMILFIPGAMAQIVMPILSNAYSKGGDMQTYNKALKYNIILNAGITLVFAILVSIFSRPIMSLYGNGFNNIWPIIILSLSTVFSSIASVVGTAIASKGQMWIGFAFNLFWACIITGLSQFFLKKGMGATGLALAVLCAYLIHTFLQLIFLRLSQKAKHGVAVH